MSGRNTRMAQWLDYRVRVTISDARMLVGTFMAFDKYMNVVLADCEEFRKIKSKGRKDEEKEVKRTLGFVVLRGETIVSLMAEAPPPTGPKKPDIQPGPGRGQVAGRGMPAAPLSSAPAGLSGPVRGVGGPAAIQMQPKACLGWVCDQLCGISAERRRASRDGNDDDVPLQHLRAAEQHLAALERWLRGEGGEKSEARAERIARELGLVAGGLGGPEAGAQAGEFDRIFSNHLEEEILIRSLPGSVKVRNFRHPGKVFITNNRLCFYSNVLGVEVSFAAKWIQIASLRLEENADTHTYPVLVSFKEPMDFDGKDVKTLDMRVFEFSDLGLLQKSATYFVGADLFGIYEEEVLSPEAKTSQSPVEKPKPSSQKLVRTASMISPDEVLKELSMWELERRTNLFRSTCPVDGETDELGWQCWQPCFYTDADDEAGGQDRAPISLIQHKAPSTAKQPIFEQVLGEISLELLGQSLESDDWKDPDSLMAFYWEETGAMDLDISPWSDGSSFASVVKGKVRTIEMRSPETRVQSTWHIVVLPDKVLLESVTMSLDVPCGTMFNVISCDSFTMQDGKLKMSRTDCQRSACPECLQGCLLQACQAWDAECLAWAAAHELETLKVVMLELVDAGPSFKLPFQSQSRRRPLSRCHAVVDCKQRLGL
eukprot:s597_g41.t1